MDRTWCRRCGARLRLDNTGELCDPCTRQPTAGGLLPAEFFTDDERMRRALAGYDFATVFRSVRRASGYSQQRFGDLIELPQDRISRIERRTHRLRDIAIIARVSSRVGIPPGLLGFAAGAATVEATRPGPEPPARPAPTDDCDLAIVCRGRRELAESDDEKHRELLRLFSMASILLALPAIETSIDADRIDDASDDPSRLGAAKLDAYAELNSHLWRVFTLSISKGAAMPLVRSQLDVLSASLQQPPSLATHDRLCALTGDLFQLAGEIFFDGNHYTEAAHCYTLAAAASKEAGAFDLWACAMTRHAFIAIYERQFDKAAPMLELAAALAQRGDSSLSTRHWVAAVQAETFAGLGDRDACERALDLAEQVRRLDGPVHNGGWLRFDGSRLAEQRGTCYVALGHPDLAEAALTNALNHTLTTRRRASVLTDLAMVGVRRGDPGRVVAYADAAMDTARQTGSGVISRKLKILQPQLAPLLGDKQVRRLNTQITALVGHTVVG